MRPQLIAPIALTFILALGAGVGVHAKGSQCHGTVSHGRLDGGVALPTRGANFSTYSRMASAAGRTHVHDKVHGVLLAAYAALATRMPDKVFVYGETGWASGGRFRPHRTHQNGLSVDFFVPVVDASGKSVPLPTDLGDRFGYDIEFDAQGRYGDYRIDLDAMAEHLYQLHVAARAAKVGIALVIFDPAYLPGLWATPRGPFLKQMLPFMKGKPWVRHDEHYHIDFAVPCRPLAAR
jgi:penicillin-insensitive murein endopeptidase